MKDYRPGDRRTINDVPCFADPTRICVHPCPMADTETRAAAIDEANKDLPSWVDTFTHQVRDGVVTEESLEEDAREQRGGEKAWHESQSMILARSCPFSRK